MKRFQDRKPNGRFRPNTLEHLAGLRILPCPACNAVNPYGRAEPVMVGGFVDPFSMHRWERPTVCCQCGAALPEATTGE